MTALEQVGDARPHDGSSAGLPAKLAQLLDERGEGALCGLTLAAPGSRRHQEMARRFAAAAAESFWLEMQGPRAERLIVVGEGREGSFIVVDPKPPEPSDAILLFHFNGQIFAAGPDLEELVATLVRGTLILPTAAWKLEHAIKEDPSMLGVPARYDTRESDPVEDMRRALQNGDEAACDAAFERLAGGMLTADMLDVMRRLLAETPNKEWQELIDKIAKRNPFAAEIVSARAKRPPPVMARLVDAGLRPGGECGENILRALRDVPEREEIVQAVTVPAKKIRKVEELAFLDDKLRTVPALEAFVWLAALREGRVCGTPMYNVTALAREDLPPIERSWPVVAIAGLHEGFQWCGPHRMQALGAVEDPLVARVVETLLVTAEATFANGAQDLAAQVRMRHAPATAEDVERWINIINAKGKRPKRYTERQREGVFALLSYAVEHDAVMRYFASDFARSPYRALRAAQRRGQGDLSLQVLRALYTAAGSIPVELRKDAAELAEKWGDRQVAAEMPHIQKAVEAEQRRMERI